MGIIPKPSPVYDDHCNACFPAGRTPSALKVFFTGIEAAQQEPAGTIYPNHGYYDVFAVGGSLCLWQSPPGSSPFCKVRLAMPHALVELFHPGVYGVFQSWDLPPCTRWFENQKIWAGNHWWKGRAFVATSLAVGAIIESVTPMIDPDPRMECFPMDNEEIVVRYAGKRDATNISIKLDVS